MKALSSVWRLGPQGLLLASVSEEHAVEYADVDNVIYFFAELQGSEELTHNEGTMLKVYDSLKAVGLSEKQINSATANMQNSGLYFREKS